MVHSKLAVLLVSASPSEAARIRAALTAVGTDPARVLTWVPTVEDAAVELAARDFDCVLLDLPDPDTLTALLDHDDTVPVIVLVGPGETALAHEALRRGAQDHLPKTDLDGRLLLRSVDYARDRQRTRAELRHTEHLYSSVVNALTEGVLVFSASGRIQTANASALDILGLSLDEVTGLPTGAPRWAAVTADGRPFPPEELPTPIALRTGEVVTGVILGITRGDGEFAWLDVSATPLIREPGLPPYGVVVSFRDTTLPRAAEQALRDIEQRQRLLLENATEGYVIVDADFRVVDASAPRRAGRSWDATPGAAVTTLLHPEDADLLRRVLTEVIDDPWTTRSVEVRLADCATGYQWAELTVSNWLRDESVRGIVLNHRDIEQRRASDEAIRLQAQMLHAVGQAVLSTDPAGVVTYANPAANRMHGWRAGEPLGRNINDLMPPGTFTAATHPTLAAGQSWSGDYTYTRPDGTELHILVNLTPVLSDAGELVSVVGVGTDITARRRAEEAMLRLSAIVESSDAAIIGETVDGEVRSWNRAAARLYGYSPDEALGRHISFLAPPERKGESEALLARLRQGQRVEQVDTAHRRKDGTLVDVSLTLSPIEDSHGRTVGISSISRDITERKRLEAEIREERRLLDEAQRLAQVGSFEVDPDTGETRWSAELYRILGVDRELPPTLERFLGCLHPDDLLAMNRQVRAALDRGITGDGVYRIVRPDGIRWVHVRARAVTEADRAKVRGTIADVTDRRRREDERHAAEERLRMGIDNAAVGIIMVDRDLHLTMINPSMRTLLGRADEDLVGRPLELLLHPDDAVTARNRIGALARAELGSYQAERRFVRRDGTTVWALVNVGPVHDAEGNVEHFFAQVQDITDRKAMEDALEHLAVHDALTELPNRTLLTDRVEHALARQSGHVAVLFVDIDRFKFVNDGMGHGAGDELLRVVSQRLRELARPGDTVARFGGDEFVIVCEELVGPHEATRVGDRVAHAIEQPMTLGGREVVVTASIGIAVAGPGATADQLLRDADAAMYRAKERGRARVEVFDEALRGRAADRLELEGALRRALAAGEFTLAYQPVVRVADSSVVGCEALLRWRHPTRGLVSPGEFIPLAEETGLIVPIGAWVLREALGQLRAWHAEGRDLSLGVNVSARQLMAPDLVETVRAAITDTGVDPQRVHLEITESVLMDDVEHSIETLNQLRELGIHFAVDDFGTGYSSLSYLKRLPIDTLKIDQSFVRGLGVAENDSSIVRAIVGMGRALGLDLLAEGVEEAAQLGELRDLGCDVAQGFLWSPAVPAADFPFVVRRPD